MSLISIRHKVELLLAHGAMVVIPRMPRRMVVGLADFVGASVALLARGQRAVARANLDIAFGDSKTPAEKNRIIRRSMQTFALTMLDLFWFSRDTAARIRNHVLINPKDEALLAGGGGRICITAHYGNWEVLGMTITARGHALTSVAAPLMNRKLDKLFLDLRERTGQRILSKHGALRGLLGALKSGGAIALVLDQNTRPSSGGVFLDFFGLPAPVSPAPAVLALRTGSPILIGVCYPDKKGDYHILAKAMDTNAPTVNAAVKPEIALTQRIAHELEAILRDQPEHWLWMYKRWKYFPPGRDRTGFPFYAKELNRKDRAAAE